MDSFSSKSPLQRWLGLGLLVLLAHLGVLQSMPVGLNPASQGADPALRFTSRVIAPAPMPAPLLPTVVVATPQKSKAARKPAAAPAAEARDAAAPDPASDEASDAGSDTASALLATPPASGQDNAAPAVPLPAVAASAAASVPELAEPAPAEPPQHEAPPARHPRARPPSFNIASLSGSVRLHYQVSANKFPYSLNGTLLWHHLGEQYEARLSYSTLGLSRSQTSRGHITATGLAPLRFADKYRSEVAAHFNYPEGKVTFSANTPDVALLTGAQDRLSVLLQLGALVASEPERYLPGTTLTVQTVGARDADLWLFSIEGTDTLDLPGGALAGLKLLRLPRKPYDQTVEVWLAAQLGYLPARIRITDANGDAIDQQWQSSEAVHAADALPDSR